MSDRLTITAPEGPIDAIVDLPRSKSVANRALVLAALAGDPSCVKDVGDAEDTRLLRNLLRDRPQVMHCGLGATTFRFLLAWAAVREGREHFITGDARLLKRPHQPLIDALRSLGADIEPMETGYRVRGRKLSGGSIVMDAPLSSQFISALLLIAPRMEAGLFLRWTGLRVSEPYVLMTLLALQHFGVEPHVDQEGIRVRAGALQPKPFTVPPDWSAAAFWFEIAALADHARVLFTGLERDHWQGDESAMDLWSPWVRAEATPHGLLIRSRSGPGPVGPSTFALRATPDLFQPLAFTCAGIGHPCTFSGLENLHAKETDRIAAVIEACQRLGLRPRLPENGFELPAMDNMIRVSGGDPFRVHGDHRMAMGLAPLSLRTGAITLQDPQVVVKSYPAFWEHLRLAGFGLKHH